MLQRFGHLSIAEIARRLNRSAGTLYQHVHKLLEVGVVVETDRRRAGRRYEAVYAVIPGGITMDFDPAAPRTNAHLKRFAGSILRLTDRAFQAAVDRGNVATHGPRRNLIYRRTKVRMTEAGLARARRHLDKAFEVVVEESRKGKGTFYALTAFLTPLE